MKIGINLLLWDSFITEDHYHLFSYLKKLGYDGVEIPLGGGDLNHYKQMHAAISSSGLECTCTMNGSAEQNILSPDSKIRQAGIDHIKWGLEMSEALGSEILGGPFYCAPSVFSGDAAGADEFEWAVESTKEVCGLAESSGVQLCAEILNRFECYFMNTVEQAREFVDAVGHDSLGIHYDTHHAHYEEASISSALSCGAEKIYHVHFSENHRGIPGSGLVDWATTIQSLSSINYNGWVVFEAFGTKNPTLRSAMHRWRKLFESETAAAASAYKFIHEIISKKESIELTK